MLRRMALGVLLLVALTAAGETFHGNTRSHVFHQSTCRYYSCANCTAQFATAREAIEHGYRPCGICKPRDSAVAEAGYVGNSSTHKFHRRSCAYASCPHCTVTFATRDDALKAGYVPGRCCNP
jgi:methylphosphotriester-DNA--protein-cysteine methyltransferase